MSHLLETNWDVVIVGGGSAGCVVANRLSADAKRRVLLIEAGQDVKPGAEPADILDPYPYGAAFNSEYHWRGLKARFGTHSADLDPSKSYEQARVLGGGSSINGLLANRGTPDDYNEWQALGAIGWGWSDVLPYFRRLERDTDATDEALHGRNGPIPVTRTPECDWPGFSKAARDAFAQSGLPELPDQNGMFDDGWFPMAVSSDGTHRVSTASGYLAAEVRARPNLAILTRTHVRKVVVRSGQTVGVETDTGLISARDVVICAGALMSPSILMRSGIGPGPHLKEMGIPVQSDLPGVGQNLQEHPSIALSAYLRKGYRMSATPRRHVHVGLRYSSCPSQKADMFMVAVARAAWHPMGQRIGSLFGWINKPDSVGWLKLSARNADIYPDVRFGLLDHPYDLVRMGQLLRKMASLFASTPLSAATRDPFLAKHGKLAALVGKKTGLNHLLTLGPALAMDGPRISRQLMINNVLARDSDLDRALSDDHRLHEAIRAFTIGGWHPCGTCRMGSEDTPKAVVDAKDGGVFGVRSLRVVDASVMPRIPRANTNIPTIMVAEKLSEAIVMRLSH